MKSIIIATGNDGKFSELELIANDLGFSAKRVDALDVPETSATFIGNAIQKAVGYAQHYGELALSDDSGVVVEALFGAPGIYTARYAAHHGGWSKGREALKDALNGKSRRAAFVSSLAIHDPTTNKTISAVSEKWGMLSWPPRGDLDMGFAPLMIFDGLKRSLAELTLNEQHAISHRTGAATSLRKQLPKLSKS